MLPQNIFHTESEELSFLEARGDPWEEVSLRFELLSFLFTNTSFWLQAGALHCFMGFWF